MGVISGYEDGSVHPEESVTREQLVKMLVVALDLKAKDETVTFNDVSNGYWSEEFISIGAANGLITGYDDGSFKPQKKVMREEMAVIINRALSIAKITITGESEAPEFADSESFSSYAAESINAVSAYVEIIHASFNNCSNSEIINIGKKYGYDFTSTVDIEREKMDKFYYSCKRTFAPATTLILFSENRLSSFFKRILTSALLAVLFTTVFPPFVSINGFIITTL
jgi:hypothetical protein